MQILKPSFLRCGIRQLTGQPKNMFLTFDDGPCPQSTPFVLRELEKYGAKATFFMVAERALRNVDLVRQIQDQGHAIGNQSLDHGYRAFFQNRLRLEAWIQSAERTFEDLTGGPTVGFRPPAGVRTPHLPTALRSLGLPLVLWAHRY